GAAELGRSQRAPRPQRPARGVLSRQDRRRVPQPRRPQPGNARHLHARAQDPDRRRNEGRARMTDTTALAPAATPAASAGANMRPTSRWTLAGREIGRAVVALLIALAATLVIIFFVSKSPGEALMTLLTAPFSKVRTIGTWADEAAKLTVTGLAFSLVFQ